jgi:hypothetical protein
MKLKTSTSRPRHIFNSTSVDLKFLQLELPLTNTSGKGANDNINHHVEVEFVHHLIPVLFSSYRCNLSQKQG